MVDTSCSEVPNKRTAHTPINNTFNKIVSVINC